MIYNFYQDRKCTTSLKMATLDALSTITEYGHKFFKTPLDSPTRSKIIRDASLQFKCSENRVRRYLFYNRHFLQFGRGIEQSLGESDDEEDDDEDESDDEKDAMSFFSSQQK